MIGKIETILIPIARLWIWRTEEKLWENHLLPFRDLNQTLICLRTTFLLMMMMNCFCGMVDERKTISLICSRRSEMSEIFTIVNLQHAASRIWTCAKPEFRFHWMKLCSSDNQYTNTTNVIFLAKLRLFWLKISTHIANSYISNYYFLLLNDSPYKTWKSVSIMPFLLFHMRPNFAQILNLYCCGTTHIACLNWISVNYVS